MVGNTLYIDGGEVTTWDGTGDGVQVKQPQPNNGNIDTQPGESSAEYGDHGGLTLFDPTVNYTYSIDLSSSWTNSSVTINTIRPKAAPVVNNEALWLDADNQTIYAYNGGLSQAPPNWWTYETPPPNGLWEFKPDIGKWVSAYISPSSIFSSLGRVTASINAYGNGLGFALGGFQTDATQSMLSTDLYDQIFVPGMVIYNIESQEWYNVSTTDYTSTGFTIQGAGLFVPPFGPNGLLFVFGGQYGEANNLQYAQFEYAWMYEPYSKTWTSQKVTGDIPAVGNAACVVGAQGDNGTYEIFMFGGVYGGDVDKTVDLSAVHVLSLPSFTWYKVADSTYGRFFHSCNVAGNRQMISVGGVVFDRSTSVDAFNVVGGRADPWNNGFGVFDMVELEWKSSFDPSAAAYVTPDVVKSNIQQNGYYPSDWKDSTVEKWFTHPGMSLCTSKARLMANAVFHNRLSIGWKLRRLYER